MCVHCGAGGLFGAATVRETERYQQNAGRVAVKAATHNRQISCATTAQVMVGLGGSAHIDT